jgi:hypothetical protein
MAREEHQQAVLAELRKQLSRDRTKTTVSGFTQLGLVEMTRKRTREPGPCAVRALPDLRGRGQVKTARSVCYDILREILREARQFNPKEFRVVASAAVVEMLLDEESQHLADLSDFIGKPISLSAEPTMNPSSTTSCCSDTFRAGGLQTAISPACQTRAMQYKNHDDDEHALYTSAERAKAASRSTWVSVAVNLVLSTLQIVVGLLAKSQGLVADGLHSLADLVSDAVVLVAGHQARKAADDDHPYGHQRFENAASMVLGVLLLVVGAGMLLSAFEKLHNPRTCRRCMWRRCGWRWAPWWPRSCCSATCWPWPSRSSPACWWPMPGTRARTPPPRWWWPWVWWATWRATPSSTRSPRSSSA